MTRLADIGALLLRLRRAQGISQRELGERLGVRQQQVARWEATEYRTVSLERVAAVAEALGYAEAMPSPGLPLAAEEPAIYEATATKNRPVRDLGEVVARIREHGDELRERFGLSSISVFGSFVDGSQTLVSDVDLLVKFSERPEGFAYFAPIDYLEQLLGRDVDLAEAHLLRDRLRPRVIEEAVRVWEA